MVNKKIISILVLISIFSSTLSYAVTVRDLYPAAKIFNAATKTWSVPAVIEAIGANGIADETVALGLTKAITGGVITTLAIAGAGYVANSYIDWLMGNNPSMYYDTDTVLKYNTHSITYSASQVAIAQMIAYNLTLPKPCSGVAPNVGTSDGYSFDSAAHANYPTNYLSGTHVFDGCTYAFNVWYADSSYDCPRTRHYWTTAINQACMGQQDLVTKHPVTPDYLNPLNEAAINNGENPLNTESPDAIDKAAKIIAGGIGAKGAVGTLPRTLHDLLLLAVQPADVTAVNNDADNKTAAQNAADAAGTNVGNLTQAQLTAALQSQGLSANAIAAAIDAVNKADSMTAVGIAGAITGALAGQGLTQAQQQAAVAAALAAANISAAQIAAAIAAANPSTSPAQLAAALAAAHLSAADIGAAVHTANPSLTQEQIEAAVEAALAAKMGADVAVPVDVLPTEPDRKSLSGVMTTFLTALSNIPIMNTLRGLTIQCSGTSTLCLNLPSRLGGNACFNAGGATDGINMVGHALLSLTSLFMFVWIFRG